jgi:putative transposase
VEGIQTPYGALSASAHVERFMRTLKEECLQQFLFFSEAQLRRTVLVFSVYYNEARFHQGIANIPDVVAGWLPARQPAPEGTGRLLARPILGGLAHDHSLAA